ncbi:uncharacterized protein [Haliotis cracherodii]|uniref:uncharacterized protein isoform X1 n=1 Tax=Haliotis cracherodii TaxID=6455 RepID=UPI0039EB4E0B
MPLSGGKALTVLRGLLQIYVLAHLNQLSVVCQPEFRCPELSDLGSSARLYCSALANDTVIKYSGPGGLHAPHCDMRRGLCTRIVGYTGTVVNTTGTELVIHDVQPRRTGTWRCEDDVLGRSSNCTVNAIKIPSCNITSEIDTDTTEELYNRSVTVDLKDLFCSTAFNFTLQVGSSWHHVLTSEAVDQPTNTNTTVILTDTTFGDVTLVFNCTNQQRTVTCGGLTHIPKNTDKEDKNRTAAIIGSVVGVLVVVVITIGIIIGLVTRKQPV